MKTYEIVFSPTGGTKKVADTLSNEINDEVIEIDLSNPKLDYSKFNLCEEDSAIIAVPSYGGRVPEVALERLKKIKGNSAKSVLVAVYGNRDYDDTLIELFDTSKEIGFKPVAAIAAIAQHSILPQYATGRPDEEDIKSLKRFMKEILSNDLVEITEVPGNRPYKKISNLPLVPKLVKNNCTSCNACVIVCPVNAIDPAKKSDKSKCISCMRCISVCPNNARKLNKMLTGAASLALKKEASERKENELFL